MLNNRYYTNDLSETRGREYGYNFSLSAWTPTEYIMAIKGNYFLQKKAQTILDTKDVHGRNICTYDDYVLEVFRSENYQYSELNNSTVFFGRIYFDENGDGLMNDGKNGLNAKLFVTVETNGGELLTEKTVINTDENGYYKITAYDKKSGDSGVSIKLTDGGCEIFGVESARESIIIRLQVYLPKEYNFTDVVSSKIWYNNINCNSFLKGEISPALDISEQTANSAIINNCLLIKK